jgi:hypothetical protein
MSRPIKLSFRSKIHTYLNKEEMRVTMRGENSEALENFFTNRALEKPFFISGPGKSVSLADALGVL